MRVLLCKIQCPPCICFCMPSSHIYSSGSLKLNNTPQVSSSTSTVVVADDGDHYVDAQVDAHVEEDDVNHVDREEDCDVEEKKKEEVVEEGHHSNVETLKSCFTKKVLDSEDCMIKEEKKKKKKVQWVDLIGKELAEIREFESSEKDMRYDGDPSCVCVIL